MLFGIMLTRHTGKKRRPAARCTGVSALWPSRAVCLSVVGINTTPFPGEAADVSTFNVENIGLTLFKQFVIPFDCFCAVSGRPCRRHYFGEEGGGVMPVSSYLA